MSTAGVIPAVDIKSKSGQPRAQSSIAVVVLLLAGVGWPVLVSVLTSPLNIPRNDAFAYTRIAHEFATTDKIQLVGYGRMSLIGHILLAQPLFRTIENANVAGNVFGIIMMSLAVVLGFFLARRFLPLLPAAGAVLLLTVAPGLANSTPTYMTETTFLASTIGVLILGLLAYDAQRHSVLYLSLAVALGFFSFTVREFGVVAPVAVLVSFGLARRPGRRPAIGLFLLLTAACLAFYIWHQHLSGIQDTPIHPSLKGVLRPILALFTLGFYVLPITIRRAWRVFHEGRRSTQIIAVVTAIFALLPLASGSTEHKLFAEDMLGRFGVSGQVVLSGTRPALFPKAVWLLLNGIALIGGICLVVVAVEIVRHHLKARSLDRVFPLETFVLLYAAVTAAYGTFVNQLDDRYIWPLILPLIIVIIVRLPLPQAVLDRTQFAMAISFALIFLTSTYLNQDAAAYDGARWQAAQQLVNAGASPAQVDGGLEWEGAHATGVANDTAVNNPTDAASTTYYAAFWPPQNRCFVVSNSPAEGADKPLGTRSYRSQFGLTTRIMYIWLRPGGFCANLNDHLKK